MGRMKKRQRPRPYAAAGRGAIDLPRLKAIPQNPRLYTRQANWSLFLRSVAEYLSEAPAWMARIRSYVVPYPKPFRRVRFESLDGTRLSGWLGIHRRGRKNLDR